MDQPAPSSPSLPPAAIAALHQGRTIEAIKIVRETLGLGLKEAKDRVDQYLASDPALQGRLAASRTQGSRSCLLVMAGLVLLAGICVFLYLRAQG